MELSKTFTYGKLHNLKYEDNDSTNLLLDVESLGGNRRVRVDEGNLVVDRCHPKILCKHVQTKNNLIIALRPYVIGELMIREA